jgi:hypothetical protein
LAHANAKLDGSSDLGSRMTRAMQISQPFYEAFCIANKLNAVDISVG